MNMTGKIIITLVVFSAAAFSAFAGPRTEREIKKELEEIKNRIEDERKRVEKTDKRKQEILNELEKTEAEYRACDRELKKLRTRRSNIQKDIGLLEAEINEHEKALKKQQSYMEERLRVRYCFGDVGSFKVMLSSESIADLARREKYLEILFERDREIMDEYRSHIEELEKSREQLRAKEEELKGLMEAKAWLEARLIQEREIKKRLIEELNEEKNSHLQMIAGLDEAQSKLEKMLKDLAGPGAHRTSAFALFKGNLCFPVPGVVEEGFGEKENPRFHTVTFHKGIDIRAEAGTPIKSIYSGNVLYADWFRGYGNLMIIDHGSGYYSLYAHAERLVKKVGEEVKRGEVIGRVGETGSIKGPFLYFELRNHGKPMDPMEWLSEECR